MSKMINFPKKPVILEQPEVPLLDVVSEVYTVNPDGTLLTIDLVTLDKVLNGKVSPTVLSDDVLRFLLKGSVDNILKEVAQQLNKLF